MNEEEKAIERCKELIKPEHSNWIGITNQKAIETVLNLIDKLNKVIDEMAKYMEDGREIGEIEEFCNKKDCYADEYINGHCQKCLNCIKQYFIRKVEEDE